MAYAQAFTRNLMNKKSAADKGDILDFYAYFYGETANIVEWSSLVITEKGYRLAKKSSTRGLCFMGQLLRKWDGNS